MKIMVCGGAGYIGSALVPKLLERGYEVTVVDLLWFGNNLPEEVEVVKKDVLRLKPSDLEGYDQVIFMAGLSNDPMAEFSPSLNFISNSAAPMYLGYISKKAGVKRFIFAGTCSVYGYTEDKLFDENSPTICNYPYGLSKLFGEKALLQMADDSFSVISLRKGTVSGYSPRMRLDLVVNTMYKTAITRGEIIVNNPSIWRPILSIDDAVSAYLRALESDYKISGIFNVASGNYTVGEVADYVKYQLNKRLGINVSIIIKNIKDYRNYKVSIEKAMNVLAFKPKHDIEDIIDSLIENEHLFNDFDNPKYYNIEMFKRINLEIF